MENKPASDHPQIPRRPALHDILAAMALGLTLLALASELITLGSRHRAAQARGLLLRGQASQALQIVSTGPCRLAPFDPDAQYARLVALKALSRWGELADDARQAVRWHPEASPVGLIEGEAAWKAGHADQAAGALWQALWQAPAPPRSAAALWLTAAWASQAAWGDTDPRLPAALCQVLAHLDDPPTPNPVLHQRLLEETRSLLDQAGMPETARAVAARMAPNAP